MKRVLKYAKFDYRQVVTFSNLLFHRFIFQLSHVKIECSCHHKQQHIFEFKRSHSIKDQSFLDIWKIDRVSHEFLDIQLIDNRDIRKSQEKTAPVP